MTDFPCVVEWSLSKVSGGWWEQFRFVGEQDAPPMGRRIAVIDLGLLMGTPVTVLSRPLPAGWGDLEVAEYFGGSLSSDQRRRSERVVGREVADMADDRFWELIGVLGGRATARSFGRLADALHRVSDEDIIAFQRTLDKTLAALDLPDLVVMSRFRGRMVPSDDATLAFRCELIVRGESVVREAISSPSRALAARKPGMRGERLSSIAGNEIARRRGVATVWIDTGIDTFPQSRVRRPIAKQPFTWASWLREFETRAELNRSFLPPGATDRWSDPHAQYTWVMARYIVNDGFTRIERMELFSFPIVVGAPDEAMSRATMNEEARSATRAAIEERARQVGATILAFETEGANPAPWNGVGFEIHRRSSLSEGEYREKYLVDARWIA